MKITRADCPRCAEPRVRIEMNADEARTLANEIRTAPGPWPGQWTRRLIERVEKLVRP